METLTTTKTDKLIVIDSRLLVSPLNGSLHNVLLKNHDIFYIDFNKNITARQQAKKINNTLYKLFQLHYTHYTFIGYKESCDIGYEIFNTANITFDSYIFLDSKISNSYISDLLKKNKKTQILDIVKGKKTQISKSSHNYIKQEYATLMPLSYHQRTAKEVIGWLTYSVYGLNYLTDPHGSLNKLV
jgi:hypothetical protein